MRKDRKVSQERIQVTSMVDDDNTEFQLLLYSW